jgi:hypothetical protein
LVDGSPELELLYGRSSRGLSFVVASLALRQVRPPGTRLVVFIAGHVVLRAKPFPIREFYGGCDHFFSLED